MSNTLTLFKDHRMINRPIDSIEYTNLVKELYDAVNKGPQELKQLLYGTQTLDEYSAHGKFELGDHDNCDGFQPNKNDETRFTEKRLCKCMYYLNGKYSEPNETCSKCTFSDRFKIIGDYKIIEYEVPAFYYGTGIGEIDLMLQCGDDIYAAEVKPYKKNEETLLRMIAEIMTYTMGNDKGYKKAIAFFEKNRETGEKTAQQKEYEMHNQKLFDLIKLADITVFQFKEVSEMEYKICRL